MMEHEWFGSNEKYYIRVYKEHDKIRLQALEQPPFPSTGYEMRECTMYNNTGTRKIRFYLDNLWVEYDVLNRAARQIFEVLCWDIGAK
jgi:hypothetical protein